MTQKFHKFSYFSFDEISIDLNKISSFKKEVLPERFDLSNSYKIYLIVDGQEIILFYKNKTEIQWNKDFTKILHLEDISKKFWARDCHVIENHINPKYVA